MTKMTKAVNKQKHVQSFAVQFKAARCFSVLFNTNQGCSGAVTRGNGVPTPFSCFALK